MAKKRKRKKLRGWVKAVLALAVILPCGKIGLNVYADLDPYRNLINESNQSKDVFYHSSSSSFTYSDGKPAANVSLSFDTKEGRERIRTDKDGKLYHGWYETDLGRNYYTADAGYLVTDACEIDGVDYGFGEDGYLLDHAWLNKVWYENGIAQGTDQDTLLFIEGEDGFYYLDAKDEGRKVINASRDLPDGRSVRFDENGLPIRNEVYNASTYYFPIPEAKVKADETKLVPVSEYERPARDSGSERLINHRGYHINAPENNLAAFMDSADMGYTFVETDIQFTADDVPVLLHNATINETARNTDGSELADTVWVSSLTLDQLNQYDFGLARGWDYAGTKITVFDEFMAFCRAYNLMPYVEFKQETTDSTEKIQQVVEIAQKYNMIGRISWISTSPWILSAVHDFDPDARIGLVTHRNDDVTSKMNDAIGLKNQGINIFLDIHYKNTDDYLEQSISAGIPLEIWGVKKKSDLDNLSPYITGVTTDDIIQW